MYDIYVDGIRVATYDSYFDVATSIAFWKIIFKKDIEVVKAF